MLKFSSRLAIEEIFKLEDFKENFNTILNKINEIESEILFLKKNFQEKKSYKYKYCEDLEHIIAVTKEIINTNFK